MTNITLIWQQLPIDIRALWQSVPTPTPRTPFNEFLGQQTTRIGLATDLGKLSLSPEAPTAPGIITDSIIVGSTSIQHHGYIASLPPGWSFAFTRAMVMRDADIHLPIAQALLAGQWQSSALNPWTITHSGLTPSTDYIIAVVAALTNTAGKSVPSGHDTFRRTTAA